MNALHCLLAAVALLLAAGIAPAAPEDTVKDISAGPMSLSYSPQNGFSLRYRGVNVIRKSTLVVHNGNWAMPYYTNSRDKNVAEVRDIDGGKEVIVRHSCKEFEGTHRISVLPDRVVFDYRYRMLGDVPDGHMDYNLGYFSATPLMGRPYQVTWDGGHKSDVIPLVARKAGEYYNSERFRRFSVETPLGRMTIEADGDLGGLNIFDARKEQGGWAQRSPILWCGVFGQPLAPGREYHQVTTISFAPVPPMPKVLREGNGKPVVLRDVRKVRMPAGGEALVIPEPKEIRVTPGDFALGQDTTIVVAKGASGKDLSGARSFAEEVRALYRLDLKIVHEGAKLGRGNLILVGEAARNKTLAAAAGKAKLKAPGKDEGYALKVTPSQVLVLGHDPAGSFYGMQTLRQLVKTKGGKLIIKGCAINDWPSLKFRGAHLFIGKDAWPFHKKLIDRVFTRYKFNHLVLESEYLKWDSAPAVAVDFAMSKEDMKKEIAYAREHFIDVSPLVQSLGHSDWMFKNGQNRNLAEDPSRPYAYCPSKPETYDFIFKVYDEAIELFKPRYFHIGHDEVTMIGKFPADEICKRKTVGDLVAEDIRKLHDHLAAKGIKTMMWGDMLLGPGDCDSAANAPSKEEARRRRDMLPRDVIITDWHYSGASPDNYQSLKLFKTEGLATIASPWYTPSNIANFAKAAKQAGCEGLLQTTWAGYNSYEGVLEKERQQFVAFVLAGEFAWNSSRVPLEDLPYRPESVFKECWEQLPPADVTRDGFTADLGGLYNARLSGTPEINLPKPPTGTVRLKGDLFWLAESPSVNAAVRVAGTLDLTEQYPERVSIPLHRKAESLIFLHTTAWQDDPDRTIGRYVVHYADGSTLEIPLIYGENIAAWNDGRATESAEPVWAADLPSGQRASLRRLDWQNPNPGKEIASVELISGQTEAGIALVALSGSISR